MANVTRRAHLIWLMFRTRETCDGHAGFLVDSSRKAFAGLFRRAVGTADDRRPCPDRARLAECSPAHYDYDKTSSLGLLARTPLTRSVRCAGFPPWLCGDRVRPAAAPSAALHHPTEARRWARELRADQLGTTTKPGDGASTSADTCDSAFSDQVPGIAAGPHRGKKVGFKPSAHIPQAAFLAQVHPATTEHGRRAGLRPRAARTGRWRRCPGADTFRAQRRQRREGPPKARLAATDDL